ncbi:glycosyltransferase [Candidatus Bathyarchaeota archaeon]|nr:glycosyltransferase [Candidatus Bathyarchaeota archaeon]
MKYSVIVTTYNDAEYLPGCFQSIENQTQTPEEVIIVNDNSTDNTEKIIEKYSFKKINSNEPKHGERWLNRVRAFKLGLKSVEKPTDLVLKIDADIIIPANYAEKLIQNYNNDPQLGASSGIQNPDKFHPLPRNGAILYKHEAIQTPDEIKEVYAWDRWILLWLKEKGYHLSVDENLRYTELRDSQLTTEEAKRSGIVRRREHYPIRGVLIQALLQGGLKSLAFLYGYIIGKGPERHNKEFIRQYSSKEEKERMKYIIKRLGIKK